MGKSKKLKLALKGFYKKFHYIKSPGTLDGGDILQAENISILGFLNGQMKKGHFN